MKYIESNNTDVYFNLALEEYVLNNLKDDIYFMFWKNDKSIVLGKYQNVFEEINIKAIEENNIKIARRNTGGGTVFHDKGNLNYSMITNYDTNTFIDYDKFILPIIKALNSIGVKAEKRRTSDISIDGKKISGSAQTIKGTRALHHGTLLFDADLSMLHHLLKTTDAKIESKSVKSVSSTVTNIKEHIDNTSMTLDEFQELLLQALFSDGICKYEINQNQIKEINELVENKYSKWEWNYGNSPDFSFEKDSIVFNEVIKVKLFVKKGIIHNCEIYGGNNLPCKDLQRSVTGCRYSLSEIISILKELNSLKVFEKIDYEKIANCFF